MLGIDVAHLGFRLAVAQQTDLPEPFGMVRKRVPEPKQPVRPAGGDQRAMEPAVLHFPRSGRVAVLGRIRAGACATARAWRPRFRPPRQRFRARSRRSGTGALSPRRAAIRSDSAWTETSATRAPRWASRVDQSLRRQAHQRLPDGRETEGETILQVGRGQPLSRHQVTVDDLGPEPDDRPVRCSSGHLPVPSARALSVLTE